ncbi:putative Oocyte-specific histone RNA stem-loop-binding protein 2 [Blattamonas nauphoetae]|uniref:Oocyte-specific histone RNA stem-loop-binding protein 2 n=1 Tax=Blattamonas nauphoetae TaxID=2049346 RepID=A0ABQ9YGG6_9EUKA|nr:putative Oocyte-specific histone RNA stem-loop-binding protein 2 [Blattamonas nauphoetae]
MDLLSPSVSDNDALDLDDSRLKNESSIHTPINPSPTRSFASISPTLTPYCFYLNLLAPHSLDSFLSEHNTPQPNSSSVQRTANEFTSHSIISSLENTPPEPTPHQFNPLSTPFVPRQHPMKPSSSPKIQSASPRPLDINELSISELSINARPFQCTLPTNVDQSKRSFTRGSKEEFYQTEKDPHRLAQRQKQVDYGKNTPGYHRYLDAIPKDTRVPGQHPHTPNIHSKCSKRTFDHNIRQWRLYLHSWDDSCADGDLLCFEEDYSPDLLSRNQAFDPLLETEYLNDYDDFEDE